MGHYERAYFELLCVSLCDSWRSLNQPVYGALRDKVAQINHVSAENVQNYFEGLAHKVRYGDKNKDEVVKLFNPNSEQWA